MPDFKNSIGRDREECYIPWKTRLPSKPNTPAWLWWEANSPLPLCSFCARKCIASRVQRLCLWEKLWKSASEASQPQTTPLVAGGSSVALLVCYVGYWSLCTSDPFRNRSGQQNQSGSWRMLLCERRNTIQQLDRIPHADFLLKSNTGESLALIGI